MKGVSKWLERLYFEQDFGRSVAISAAGAIVLIVYLRVADGLIAVCWGMICFPIARMLASSLHEVIASRREERQRLDKIEKKARLRKERALRVYEQLSWREQMAVMVFVDQGGCVIPQRYAHELGLTDTCIESLRKRKQLEGSTTADGYRETFVLNADLFDVAREKGFTAEAPF